PGFSAYRRHAVYLRTATFCVFHSRTKLSLLFCTRMIRHGRPWTVCSFGVYVTGPEIVGWFLKCSMIPASLAPLVEPPLFLSAAASRSIVAAPSTKLAVYGIFF